MQKTLESEAVRPELPLRAVDRAIGELRRGRSLALLGAGARHALVASAELITSAGLQEHASLAAAESHLVLTRRRADALGLTAAAETAADGVVGLALQARSAADLRALADPLLEQTLDASAAGTLRSTDLDRSAIELTKLAHLLPAALVTPLSASAEKTLSSAYQRVSAQAVNAYRIGSAENLERVSEAKVPLFDAEDTRIVTFRPRNGGFEHLAIIIGTPDPKTPVLVRLHSECLTGDLLGSLRCDCGDQLRGAIQTISEAGSGVLIYLAQEGRGIGLANKLRAYGLQDRGADTLEANEQLGFDPDERIFVPAASILRALDIARIRLLTNNPQKVEAMTRLGIEVAERVPLVIAANPYNAAYLDTKARRFGHQF